MEEWDERLASAARAVNNRTISYLGVSPVAINFGDVKMNSHLTATYLAAFFRTTSKHGIMTCLNLGFIQGSYEPILIIPRRFMISSKKEPEPIKRN